MARNKVKLWIEPEGMSVVRNSAEVKDLLRSTAQEIAERAKGNYRVEVKNGAARAHANILPDDVATYYDNLHNNNLLKAVK